MQIKSTEAIAEKWARVTPQRAEDYSMGVSQPRRSWAQAAAAANDTYKESVIKAANSGRYARGVNEAGDQKWQSKTMQKGPSRFSQGVAEAGPDFANGFAPYAQVISSTNLPPRYGRGDPRNIERVSVIAKALAAKRMGSTR